MPRYSFFIVARHTVAFADFRADVAIIFSRRYFDIVSIRRELCFLFTCSIDSHARSAATACHAGATR